MRRFLSKGKRQESQSIRLASSYERSLFWSRASLCAFFVIYVATILWAIPWLPYGMRTDDYDGSTTFFVILLLGASATAFGAVFFRDRRRRVEQTLASWNTVHDGLTDLRRREYFFDRIVIECERAQADQRQFTVLVLNLGQGRESEVPRVQRALSDLSPNIKEIDCVGAIGPHEIGILAPTVTKSGAVQFALRLLSLGRTALGDDSSERLRAAYAVFPHDATEAGEIVGVARSLRHEVGRQPDTEVAEATA